MAQKNGTNGHTPHVPQPPTPDLDLDTSLTPSQP